MKTVKIIAALFFLLSLPVMACGCSGNTPSSTVSTVPVESALTVSPSYEILIKDGFADPSMPRITSEDLKLQLDSGEEIILIDSRSEYKIKMGYLPGAISIRYAINSPYPGEEDEMDRKLAALPNDTMKVLYCDCARDEESAAMARRLVDSGFDIRNIRVLWKGYFRWLELGYPVVTE
jgi:rhodanese-related sulfurtransferase